MKLLNYLLKFLRQSKTIQVTRVSPKAKLPTRATGDSAGWDLYSAEDVEIGPYKTVFVSIGLVMKPPEGYHIKIYSRSGIANKQLIGMPHSVGIIDRDYSGSTDIIKVPLRYTGSDRDWHSSHCILAAGTRIAQMILEKTEDVVFEETDNSLSHYSRGGFGSTGLD